MDEKVLSLKSLLDHIYNHDIFYVNYDYFFDMFCNPLNQYTHAVPLKNHTMFSKEEIEIISRLPQNKNYGLGNSWIIYRHSETGKTLKKKLFIPNDIQKSSRNVNDVIHDCLKVKPNEVVNDYETTSIYSSILKSIELYGKALFVAGDDFENLLLSQYYNENSFWKKYDGVKRLQFCGNDSLFYSSLTSSNADHKKIGIRIDVDLDRDSDKYGYANRNNFRQILRTFNNHSYYREDVEVLTISKTNPTDENTLEYLPKTIFVVTPLHLFNKVENFLKLLGIVNKKYIIYDFPMQTIFMDRNILDYYRNIISLFSNLDKSFYLRSS